MKARVLMLLLFSIVLMAGCGNKGIENATDWPIEDFKATNQANQPLGLKDLKGKVWISDFVFTSCADVCPPMTSNLAKLQQRLKDEGLKNVQIVSFSVDPTVDTPERLTQFANQFNADYSNWTFLTGYTQEFIENFALKSYKAIVKKPEEGSQVIHGTSFYLVDQNGHIKKSYKGFSDVPFDEIIHDIKALQ